MIIKATRLQAWAPAGGRARVGHRPPPSKNFFGAKLEAFLLLFLHMEAFLLRFLILGAFWLLFISWCRLFWACTPPPRKISAGAHDCKEGSRACSPEIFLCDRNLVSSGHVLLRFCLKNEKK